MSDKDLEQISRIPRIKDDDEMELEYICDKYGTNKATISRLTDSYGLNHDEISMILDTRENFIFMWSEKADSYINQKCSLELLCKVYDTVENDPEEFSKFITDTNEYVRDILRYVSRETKRKNSVYDAILLTALEIYEENDNSITAFFEKVDESDEYVEKREEFFSYEFVECGRFISDEPIGRTTKKYD